MPYLQLTPFVNNKQYRGSETIQVVVFVYIFEFNFALTLSNLEVY